MQEIFRMAWHYYWLQSPNKHALVEGVTRVFLLTGNKPDVKSKLGDKFCFLLSFSRDGAKNPLMFLDSDGDTIASPALNRTWISNNNL